MFSRKVFSPFVSIRAPVAVASWAVCFVLGALVASCGDEDGCDCPMFDPQCPDSPVPLSCETKDAGAKEEGDDDGEAVEDGGAP